MREIVIDTETTGLDPADGHRVIEIACVELLHHIPSGRSFQTYLNPKRDIPPEAFAVHGLSAEFLADKPEFAAQAAAFLEFIGDDQLVIHNAEFDLKFINAELTASGHKPLPYTRVVDTLAMARRRFVGAPCSLDALCKRFAIDNAHRDKHGALVDAELLAQVYVELIGGRQPGLELATVAVVMNQATGGKAAPRQSRAPRPHAPSPDELAAHQAFLAAIKDPLWSK
ncbi:MAG: DNA polymerase III subunit epsilon [Alphaproteobacteria bacterium]|nr:DNA polymerase III subunit epsilon [Alphaproteobacteria bacterium]